MYIVYCIVLQLVYTVWSNDEIGTSLNSTHCLFLPRLLLLLLLIVIYDGVGTYNEISIYDQLSDSVDCSI